MCHIRDGNSYLFHVSSVHGRLIRYDEFIGHAEIYLYISLPWLGNEPQLAAWEAQTLTITPQTRRDMLETKLLSKEDHPYAM